MYGQIYVSLFIAHVPNHWISIFIHFTKTTTESPLPELCCVLRTHATLQYACFCPRTPCNQRNNVSIVFLESFSDPIALEGLSMWEFTWVSPRMDPELGPENGHNRVYGLRASTWGNDFLWTRTSFSSQIPASLPPYFSCLVRRQTMAGQDTQMLWVETLLYSPLWIIQPPIWWQALL